MKPDDQIRIVYKLLAEAEAEIIEKIRRGEVPPEFIEKDFAGMAMSFMLKKLEAKSDGAIELSTDDLGRNSGQA